MTKVEAINIVRNIHQTDAEKEALEMLIPELAESEDEGVRKELHNIIRRSINDPNLPYEKRLYISKSVLPYIENLEKQKEQNPAEWSEEDERNFNWISIGFLRPFKNNI